MRDIQELLLLGVEEVNLDESQLLPLPPKEIYEKIFTKYMLRTDLSEHHIIFKNKNVKVLLNLRYSPLQNWI